MSRTNDNDTGHEIIRTVGRRIAPPAGVLRPPTEGELRWFRDMAKGRIIGRKGIQRFATHEEADADREKWVAREVAQASARLALRAEKG